MSHRFKYNVGYATEEKVTLIFVQSGGWIERISSLATFRIISFSGGLQPINLREILTRDIFLGPRFMDISRAFKNCFSVLRRMFFLCFKVLIFGKTTCSHVSVGSERTHVLIYSSTFPFSRVMLWRVAPSYERISSKCLLCQNSYFLMLFHYYIYARHVDCTLQFGMNEFAIFSYVLN